METDMNRLRPSMLTLASEDRDGNSTRAEAVFSLGRSLNNLRYWKSLKFTMPFLFGPRNTASLHVRRLNNAGPPSEDYGKPLVPPPDECLGSHGIPYFVNYTEPAGAIQTTTIQQIGYDAAAGAMIMASGGGNQINQGNATNWLWGGYQSPNVGAQTHMSNDQIYGTLGTTRNIPGVPTEASTVTAPGWTQRARLANNAINGQQASPGGDPLPFQAQMARIFEAAMNDVLFHEGLVRVEMITTTPREDEDFANENKCYWPFNLKRSPFVCVEPGGVAYTNLYWMGSWVNNTLAFAFGFSVPAQEWFCNTDVDKPVSPLQLNYYRVTIEPFEFMVQEPDVAAIFGLTAGQWYPMVGPYNPTVIDQNHRDNATPGGTGKNRYFSFAYGQPENIVANPPPVRVEISLLEGGEQSMTAKGSTLVAFNVPINTTPGGLIEYISDTMDWNMASYAERVDRIVVKITDYWGQKLNDETSNPYRREAKRAKTELIKHSTDAIYSDSVTKNRFSSQFVGELPPWSLLLGTELAVNAFAGVKRGPPRV